MNAGANWQAEYVATIFIGGGKGNLHQVSQRVGNALVNLPHRPDIRISRSEWIAIRVLEALSLLEMRVIECGPILPLSAD
jgi:hypothetical protein